MNIYHKQIGFPSGISVPSAFFGLRPTKHAIDATRNDPRGKFSIPSRINDAEVFEIAMDGGKVIKYGARVAYNNKYDMVLIISDVCNVITAWLTDKNDNHSTLDLSRYNRI